MASGRARGKSASQVSPETGLTLHWWGSSPGQGMKVPLLVCVPGLTLLHRVACLRVALVLARAASVTCGTEQVFCTDGLHIEL